MTPFAVVFWTTSLLAAAVNAAHPPPQEDKVQLQLGDDAIRASFRLGTDKVGGTITVNLTDDAKHVFKVSVDHERIQHRVKEGDKTVAKKA
jgi:hypothetical protein